MVWGFLPSEIRCSLESQCVRGGSEEGAGVLGRADIGCLCRRRHVENLNVFDHVSREMRDVLTHWGFCRWIANAQSCQAAVRRPPLPYRTSSFHVDCANHHKWLN